MITLSEMITKTEDVKSKGATPLQQEPVVPSVPKAPTLNDLVAKTAKVQPTAKKPSISLTVQDVINDPERLSKIRKMLSTTKDVYYETAPAEEVMETFMTHMRWVNTNEISTAKEAINVTAADDKTRAVYGEAYKIYDEMGSMFSNGDAWNGTIDYGASFIASPSLYLGLGVGKIFGAVGTKATGAVVRKLGIEAAKEAIEVGAKEIAKKSAGKITAQTAKADLTNFAAKGAARWQLAGQTITETGLAGVQDYMLQDIRMDVGVQDEYSFLQTVTSSVLGAAGGIPGAIALRRSANSSLAETGKLLDESYARRAKTAAKRAAPKIKEALEKKSVEWAKLAEAGKGLPQNDALNRAISDWFYNPASEDSLYRIIAGEGADLSLDNRFTESIVNYAMSMGDEALAEFNKALEPLGITFGEAVERTVAAMKSAGETFNPASQAKRHYNEFRNTTIAKKTSGQAILDALGEAVEDAPVTERDLFGYTQSLWKKMLVSTYPTTAVNVKGWAIARSASAMADVVAAGGLMGRAGMRAIMNPAASAKDLAKARSLLANQTFALQTLVDPFLSAEAFLAMLERAPSRVKKRVTGQIYGGIDDFGPERFGLNPQSKGVKASEGISNIAQKVSFVHLQDTLTKGMSGLAALDKQSRIHFGKGIQKLIEDGEFYKISDDMWEQVTKAVLRDTFSEDLTRGKGILSDIARIVENVSNRPLLGYVVPFGRFLNSTVAFTYRHSLLGFIGVGSRVFKSKVLKKEGVEGIDEVGEMAARATVGTVFTAYIIAQELQKQEEGLQWFERRNEDGSVEDITNLFPYSAYSLIGRIWNNWKSGEGVDRNLTEALMKQIGPLESLETVSGAGLIADVARYLDNPSIEEGEKAVFMSTLEDALAFTFGTAADVAAGFTRPLDIYSRLLSQYTPEAGGGVTIDRKQAEGVDRIVQGLTRYVSGFTNYLLGEETEYGVRLYGAPKESAISQGPVKIPNPAGTVFGETLQPPARNFNKLLGMVDKPPFRADSFTSGLPEYDAFINQQVTPLLEARAKALLNNPVFMKAPASAKRDIVDTMIKDVRNEVVGMLEGRRIGDPEDVLNNERRKLLVRDSGARKRAMKALGITTDEAKLSLYEIEAIRFYIDLEKDQFKALK